MPKTCYIKFAFERSCLAISVSDSETERSISVTRGRDSIDQINDLSLMYRSLVVLRSFADENDQGVISLVENLGRQLYSLFFSGLEDFLESYSHLLIEHNLFLLPLELAFDGREFLGLKFSIGNWIQRFGRRPSIDQSDNFKFWLRREKKVLFLGEENELVSKVFDNQLRSYTCEKMPHTRAEQLIEKLNTNSYLVLHFAGHGHFNETHPEQSYLILGREEAGQAEWALLRSSQIKHAHLSHCLVFLNACQSGRVEENYLGFIGFADDLLRSGATSCITTLWSISDRSATRFAADFYKRLLNGKPIGEALRDARIQCWIDKRDILTSLSYLLFGDPSRSYRGDV